jgi:hypothetical protein
LRTPRMNSSPIFRTRAGGVSPPWVGFTAANRKRTSQQVYRACKQERGASAPRGIHPPLRIVNAYRRRYVAHATKSGGALALRGKSPPLRIVNVYRRRYVAHATRSGGASAPRGKHPPLRIGKAYRRRHVAHATRSGGRQPPVECSLHASAKRGKSSHGTCRRDYRTTAS